MTGLVKVSDHVQAVVDHLNDDQLGSLNAGRGVPPEVYGWQGAPGQSQFVPYCIVWRIGSKDAVNRNLDDVLATEGRLSIFIRCFGGTVAQVEDHLDELHARMLSGLTVPGRHVVWVRMENGQTSTRSDDVEVTKFEAGNFYRLRTRPADEE